MSFQTIESYLSWDHHEIGNMLRDVGRIVEDDERERAEHTFAEFRARLDRHIRIEEDTLFPLFEASIGSTTGGPTFIMRLEHIEIGKLADEMGEAIDAWHLARFGEAMRELRQLLAAHDFREEQFFCPRMDRLAGAERGALVARIEREP